MIRKSNHVVGVERAGPDPENRSLFGTDPGVGPKSGRTTEPGHSCIPCTRISGCLARIQCKTRQWDLEFPYGLIKRPVSSRQDRMIVIHSKATGQRKRICTLPDSKKMVVCCSGQLIPNFPRESKHIQFVLSIDRICAPPTNQCSGN